MTVDREERAAASGWPDVEDLDGVLLDRVRAGDRSAFGTLYDRHVRTVYRYAVRLCATPRDAEDATQDVFVLAFEKARSITLVGDSALPWLLVACRNISLAKRRRALRDSRQLMDLDADTVVEEETTDVAAERRMLGVAIDQAIAQLSDIDRRLFILCTEMGRSYQQAAAELGVSHASVRNRLARLRSRLQASLADHKEVGA